MKKMIDYLQYSALSNWLYTSPEDNTKVDNSGQNIMMIAELVTRVMDPVAIHDNQLYSRLTIKTKGAGAIVREKGGKPEKILGKEIGRKHQFMVHSGQLVVSSIDARNGAVGIVPMEAEGCVVTDNFWVFDVNVEKVEPFFLQLVLARPMVNSQIEAISHGTTNRQYITIDQFLKLKIVLPTLTNQREFLARYKRIQSRKVNLQTEIDAFGSRRNDIIAQNLGTLSSTVKTGLECFFDVAYQDLYKWSIGSVTDTVTYKKTLRLRDCIDAFMTKEERSLRITPQKTPTRKYRYIGMEGVEKNLGMLVDVPKVVAGYEIKSSTVEVPKGYVIYGKLRPNLNKYWLNDSYQDGIICSSEFLVFRPSDKIDLHYFLAVLGSDYIQKQIVGKLAGTRMPRMSSSVFFDLDLPEPDMDTQRQVGAEFVKLQNNINKKRKKLKRLTEVDSENLYKQYGI